MSEPTSGPHFPWSRWHSLYSFLCWLGLLFLLAVLLSLLAKVAQYHASVAARSRSRVELLATMEALATAEPVAGTSGTAVTAPAVELPAVCAACHTIAGTSATGVAGPDLTNIGRTAEERLRSPDYRGAAESASQYIRESILQPDAYLAPGTSPAPAGGKSTMPAAAGQSLRPDELERLIASLASRR